MINSGREPLGYISEWNTCDDPIGVTSRGVSVGSITWQEGRYYRGPLNYSVTVVQGYSFVNIRYLYFMLQKMQSRIRSLCTFDCIPALNAGNLKELQIPIPCPGNPEKSLAVQSEIVRILDKFDSLTTSLTEGLPREIELRRRQYAYYRDLLLNFPQAA